MNVWWLLPLAAVGSALLTGLLRRYALARSVLDVPNDRSSHTLPTPRGGGVAIVVAFLAGLVVLATSGAIDFATAVALGGGGFVVAMVGFLDDHRHIATRWRLLVHVVAAIWVLTWLRGFPPLGVLGVPVPLGWAGHVLAVVYLVWGLNLYNFMDGIDGVAGLEAVTVGVGAAAILFWHAPSSHDWALPALLASAALGFLVWNWPPAQIFMGDAGSGFLGLMLGAMSIWAAWLGSELWWSWVILLAVFVVDATVTLLRRVQRRERLHEAHCSHAYQVAARRFGAHRPVTLAVGAINVFWLLPVAFAVATGWLDGVVGVLVGYAPVVWLTTRFGDGA